MARPAPPYFATCSTYKRLDPDEPDHTEYGGILVDPTVGANRGVKRFTTNSGLAQNRQQSTREPPESPATRPEDLGIRSWYNEQFCTIDSPSSSVYGGICDRSSYPSLSAYSYQNREGRNVVVGKPNLSLHSASRERESSLESNDAPCQRNVTAVPRKAYMDLTDAMALLDETCPNQDVSPSLTPRTPHTPLTPFPRNKRARSKSSDNSSNYSNEITAERNLETSKNQEKWHQEIKYRRPFLRKIGVSKTEDRPLLAKIIAPKSIGKPYLEKIGPSRAVDKPFLEKIGSSKTLDIFTFDALRELPRAMVKKRQPAQPSPLTIERAPCPKDEEPECLDEDDDVLCIIKDEPNDSDNRDDRSRDNDKLEDQMNSGCRSIGKGYLLKMYSFETEDLDENTETSVLVSKKAQRDRLRGTSLENVLDSGPSSLPPSEDSHEQTSSRSDARSTSVAELVKCRVTTSEEIFSSISGSQGSPLGVTSCGGSPCRSSKRRSRRVTLAPRRRDEREKNGSGLVLSDESMPNSPSKRQLSPDPERGEVNREVVARTKNSSLPRNSAGSPMKTRRQASNEEATSSDSRRDLDTSKSSHPSSEENYHKEETPNFARCKSRRQTFKKAMEKFGGAEYSPSRTRRQASEEILDRNRKNGELQSFNDPLGGLERRGISSDNLKLSRETVVASVPSTSSLGYQSGDSSLVSQRSSYHSQDFIRGTLKILHDKFELREVPSESYAAFKRRTRSNNHHYHLRDNQRTNISDIHADCSRNEDNVTNNNTLNTTINLIGEGEEAIEPKKISDRPANKGLSTESKSSVTSKSVLRKQDGVDHQSDHETDNGSIVRRPKRRIFNEPSQETMDLLTELRRVKSMLKTPSAEAEGHDDIFKPPPRLPKKILLTDKEFCLSVERENSVRRRPSAMDVDDSAKMLRKSKDKKTKENDIEDVEDRETSPSPQKIHNRTSSRRQRSCGGPALFEKRCLSLDYADDEKPPKPEARAISLVATSRTPRSVTGVYETPDSSDPAGLAYDTRSYSSDVFTSPSDENEELRGSRKGSRSHEESPETGATLVNMTNHYVDVDIAIPVDHVGTVSPKRRTHAQGRTSDLYEIISPRSTPFRVKKRLGRISIEETVKPENFTLNKVDCKTAVSQKRTKCFPL